MHIHAYLQKLRSLMCTRKCSNNFKYPVFFFIRDSTHQRPFPFKLPASKWEFYWLTFNPLISSWSLVGWFRVERNLKGCSVEATGKIQWRHISLVTPARRKYNTIWTQVVLTFRREEMKIFYWQTFWFHSFFFLYLCILWCCENWQDLL